MPARPWAWWANPAPARASVPSRSCACSTSRRGSSAARSCSRAATSRLWTRKETARAAGAPARSRAISVRRRMGVASADRTVNSFPHQFSGGMRQRVMLAMGFSNEPSLLIADEPTTALDVTIQAQILDLLRGLNRDLGTAVILISHDLGVIANICQRVLVMYAGEVVEEGAPEELLTDPRHPSTWALLHPAPRIDV